MKIIHIQGSEYRNKIQLIFKGEYTAVHITIVTNIVTFSIIKFLRIFCRKDTSYFKARAKLLSSYRTTTESVPENVDVTTFTISFVTTTAVSLDIWRIIVIV